MSAGRSALIVIGSGRSNVGVSWIERVHGDPLSWLLAEDTPAVRAAALQRLLDRPLADGDVVSARREAMRTEPIRSILETQEPEGWWAKPGPGYSPKYRSTVWQIIFLDQLGADGTHPQVQRACDYVLRWTSASGGGFGCSGALRGPPPPSRVIHCLNGNLVRAFLGFGLIDDDRVATAIDWAARTILAEDVHRWYESGTSGPLFACGANEGLPCAWGGLKELSALARIPEKRRSPRVLRAIGAGVDFLFSRDPATADYPMGWGNVVPNRAWFRPGFPLGYQADVLQTLEVLAELGYARDARVRSALSWLEAQQDRDGRWRNRHAFAGKTWGQIEPAGVPSKWVTLRACTVLRAAYG